MGLIICENCEYQEGCNIVKMSKSLHNYFINNERIDIIKLIYEVKILNSIDSFVQYFSIEDDISKNTQIKNIEDFENFYFNEKREDEYDVGCVNRFRLYLDENNIDVKEKIVKILD